MQRYKLYFRSLYQKNNSINRKSKIKNKIKNKEKRDTENMLNIITHNVMILKSDERLLELDNTLTDIKWDIIGLSEVRRKGEETIEWENDILYY